MRIEELDTPALIVDLDILEGNIRSLADYARQHGIALRPHTKTHKIPAIARMQVDAGARGITVAKLGEAEVMAGGGLDDILVAYPILGDAKTARLARLAAGSRVTVALDSAAAAEGVSRAASRAGVQINVLVEFDAGLRRCGVQSAAEVVSLARDIHRLQGLRFQGLFFYPGDIWAAPPDQGPALARLGSKIGEKLEALRKAGFECPVVSGGSTPTAYGSHLVEGLTEIRPGTYVFNDLNEARAGACSPAQCALQVMVTVVSTAVAGRVVVDGGSKTFSSDRLLSGDRQDFGFVIGHPELQFASMSEEHGHLEIAPGQAKPRLGDKLAVIPNHVCPCVNLHDRVYYHRQGTVEGCWTVEGRGRVQ